MEHDDKLKNVMLNPEFVRLINYINVEARAGRPIKNISILSRKLKISRNTCSKYLCILEERG